MSKLSKKLFVPLLLVLILLAFAACNSGEKELVTYKSENGPVSIDLPGGFKEETDATADNVSFYFVSDDNIVTFLSEDRATVEYVYGSEGITLDEYAKLIVEVNGLSSNVGTDSAGNTYFTYNNVIDGEDLFYYAVVKENGDTLWLVNFICPASMQADGEANFPQWAKSIKFA